MSNNPFPGLRHFEAKETHLFFGRDGQNKELLRRLQESRFLALVGVSGSGKSSLVRAGLLPALHGGLMASVESDWRIAVFRPGNNPIGNMACALITQAGFGSGGGQEEIEIAMAETTLRRGNLGLLELIKQSKRKVRPDGRPFLGDNENVLLVVDQFEEIFRIIEQYDELVRVKHLSEGNHDPSGAGGTGGLECHPREDASAFVKLLLESTRKNSENGYDENIYIIVTMRSDYLGETAQFWGMPERINEGQYLIPRMTRDERRQAIVGPVAVAGGAIDEPLVNQLLNDAGENPGHLPILQHALMRMWEVGGPTSRKNGGLNIKDYDAIGKLSGALSQHANEAFAELSPELQTLTAKVFKCLTEKGMANREIRRPMTVGDICNVIAAEETDVNAIIECFRKEGRWFLMPPPAVPLEPDTLIDISHESLIKGWDKLTKWVNEEADSARTYRRLADTAILKERGEEDFYRGPALQLALKWRQDNTPNPAWARRYHPEYKKAITFLDDSLDDTRKREQAEQDRVAKDSRRRRNYKVILAILMMSTTALAIVTAGAQRRSFVAQQHLAQREREKADLASAQKTTAEEGEREADRLKVEAQIARQLAENALHDLDDSFKKEQAAVAAAKQARALAVSQRDLAQQLQTENQEQATTYEYFKTAFNDIAAQEYPKAVASLRNALKYFEQKEEKAVAVADKNKHKADRISTHINIADVYRTASGAINDRLSVQEYDRAIALIGSSNNDQLASTLMKAGRVWKDSTEEPEAGEAAKYFERAAGVYLELNRPKDVSRAWIEAGRPLAALNTNESAAKAVDHFSNAVLAHGDDNLLIASTRASIGEIYLKLLGEDAEIEEEDDDPAPGPVSGPDDAAARESAEERLRETGARFFAAAGSAYYTATEMQKAADMYRKQGLILSGSNSPRNLMGAEGAFRAAAGIYARLRNGEKQKEILLEAGDLFVASENAYGKRIADTFYQSLISLAGGDNVEKAEVLTEIGRSLGTSADVTLRQKAVEYYLQAETLYHAMNRPKDEIAALLAAGNLLRELNDDESKTKAKQLYEHAIAVYENDPAQQVSTLTSIGDAYRRSAQPAKKEQAVEYYRRAATLARQHHDRRQEVNSLIFAGMSMIGINTPEAQAGATKIFAEAVNVYLNDVPQQVATLTRIGSIYAGEQPPREERALENYQRAIVLAREHNDKTSEVNAILAKARGVERFGGDDRQARIDKLYDEAIAVYNDNPAKQVDTIVKIGTAIFGSGREQQRNAKAEEYFTRALNVAAQQSDKKIAADAELDIGFTYSRALAVKRTKALEHYNKALALYEAAGNEYGQASVLYRLTSVNRTEAADLANRSLALYNKLLPALQSSGSQHQLAEAYYAIGWMLHRHKKDYKAALQSYNKAREIFTKRPELASRLSVTNTQIRAVQRLIDTPPKAPSSERP